MDFENESDENDVDDSEETAGEETLPETDQNIEDLSDIEPETDSREEQESEDDAELVEDDKDMGYGEIPCLSSPQTVWRTPAIFIQATK